KLQLAMRNQDGSAGSGFSYTPRVGVHWVLPAAGIYYLICHNSGTAELALLDFNFNDTISPTIGNMRYVPDGSFQRDGSVDNITQVSTFLLSQYEITRAQYQAVMGTDPSLTANSSGTDDPVQNVSWYEALVFCNKLSLLEGLTPVYSLTYGGSRNPAVWGPIPAATDSAWNNMQADWMADGYRLPTDMEFIWASIGGRAISESTAGYTVDTTGWQKKFAGDDLSTLTDLIGDYAWYGYGASGNATEAKTRPVGSFRPNELTIYDLSGNVNEWCWDGFGTPPLGPIFDYRGMPAAPNKIRRGGSWATPDTNLAIINSDISAAAEQKYGSMGFRVARVPPDLNNYLQNLIPGAGELEPSFKPENPEYMIQLDNSFSSINFSATAFAADDGATVSFMPGNPAPLSVGPNEITITVQGMRTGSRQYRVRVYRGAPGEILANKAGLLVPVPAGNFQFDPSYVNQVTNSFLMGKFEVTSDLFSKVMGYPLPVSPNALGPLAPASKASWYHAIAFCNTLSLQEGLMPVYSISSLGGSDPAGWGAVPNVDNTGWNTVTADFGATGYRLPSEMEWMWAAMGATAGSGYSDPYVFLEGANKAFAGSDGGNLIDDFAWYGMNSEYRLHPVGLKLPNELGIHDLSGSVLEWCWDNNGTLPVANTTDYLYTISAADRINHGGAYNAASTSELQPSFRNFNPAYYQSEFQGFRVVRKP
ncbi:MAG: SUMF1/EgtB/PvdO family nonheme iron enzyme, partial [Spirochaetes bacterium]|nr:SUMF1/EgtB/PvdO family nonheme iron enzyme [Spirochaetota bacterium]